MPDVIRRLWGNEQVRFLAVGGLNAVLAYAIFAGMYFLLAEHIHYMFILVLVTITSNLVSYMNQKFLVFRTRGRFLREFVRFVTVNLSGSGIGFVLFPVAIELLKMDPYVAQALIMVIAVTISYLGHKHFSFRRG